MKKKLIGIFLVSILVFGTTITGFASTVSVFIDGKELKSEVPAQVINGRTLVPLSSIFAELGANVNWNQDKQKITATKNDTIIELIVNNNTAYVNGKATKIDVSPQIINSRTMVPLSFISTSLNADISWNESTKTATITTRSQTNSYEVLKVVDGDTIKVMYDGKEEYVRMIGVDTPESVHPDESKNVEAGKTASEFTSNMLLGKQIELEFDVQQRDKYNRLLAYVYIDGKMFNKTLLEEGYAVIATYPPNVKYVEDFEAISSKTNPVISNLPSPNETTKK